MDTDGQRSAERPDGQSGHDSGPRSTESLGVLAADAVPLVRVGLRSLVTATAGWHWLGSLGEARMVLVTAARLRPDVLLLDGMLDPDAWLTRMLRSRPSAPIVAVLARDHDDADAVRRFRRAGANAVLARDMAPAAMLSAVRAAKDHARFVPPVRAVPDIEPRKQPSPSGLSQREQQVLHLISEGMNNYAIGEQLLITKETVRTHVKAILRKLDVRDRAHAVARAYTLGIVAPAAYQPPTIHRTSGVRQESVRPGPVRQESVRQDAVRPAANASR